MNVYVVFWYNEVFFREFFFQENAITFKDFFL